MRIYAGSTTRGAGQMYRVSRTIIHPQHAKNIKNDIALLQVKGPGIEMSDVVQPACLPKGGDRIQPGTVCYTTGWGRTNKECKDFIRNN